MTQERIHLLSQHERNVVVMARRCNGDFAEVARELGGRPDTIKAVFESARAKLQGDTAPIPAAAPHTERRLTVPADTSRSTDDVLGDALAELERRRTELIPLVAELKNIDKAMATLRKATGQGAPAASNGNGGKRNYTVSEQTRAKVLEALSTDEPTDRSTVAERAGIAAGPYLYAALNQLEQDGAIAKVDGGYALVAQEAQAA